MYSVVSSTEALTQGDILAACPVHAWKILGGPVIADWQIVQSEQSVLILTQACDLMNSRATRVQVAVVQAVEQMVELGILSRATIRDQVRLHRVFGLYFLPEWEGHLSESIVDPRNIHTVPLKMLEELARKSD